MSKTASKQDPTPAEIAELCLQIQSEWSAREKLSRLRVDLRPTYQRCDGERLEMGSEDYDEHHRSRDGPGVISHGKTSQEKDQIQQVTHFKFQIRRNDQ